MIGLTERSRRGPIQNISDVSDAYFELLEDASYRRLTGRATADRESVTGRITRAVERFAPSADSMLNGDSAAKVSPFTAPNHLHTSYLANAVDHHKAQCRRGSERLCADGTLGDQSCLRPADSPPQSRAAPLAREPTSRDDT